MSGEVFVAMDSIAGKSEEADDDTMTAGDGTGIVTSTIGLFLHMFFVALPKDIWRLLNLKRKDIRGQTVVITGGASGIGQRMAQIFSLDEGANVAIIDVDEKKAIETCEEIQKQGGSIKYWICDISKAEAMEKAAEEIQQTFGQVHIVVCNAAILYFGHMLELTTEQLRRAMDVNIVGTMITIRSFLPEMERFNSGQIVAVASVAGYFGETYGMAYCPAKFAVRGIMECLEMEMRDRGLDGIKCTTVCPWFIRTPMILNMGMRPTSRLLPFMSINRAATQIVDAILKEKIVSFIPFMVGVIVFARSLLTHHMQRAGRVYLNARYEPMERAINNNEGDELSAPFTGDKIDKSQDSDTKMPRKITTPDNLRNFFKFAPLYWYLIIVPALFFNFITWYRPEWIPVNFLPYLGDFAYFLGTKHSWIPFCTNIFALVAHIGEAVYALHLCDKIGLTHAASFKWFLQTLIVGFASLSILVKEKNRLKFQKR
uniref:Transmembrane protein 254 n=1 Tax=Panagrolaimus sp. JU765 TaxID=591449 RepID=A0AC34PYA4_9BILA